jgi:hypothetical protein
MTVSDPEPLRDGFTAAADVPDSHHVRLDDVLATVANFVARNPQLDQAVLAELTGDFRALENVAP